MNTDRIQKGYREVVVSRCWEYLRDNFHKFSQENKIKITLELCKKDMPTQLEHSGEVKFTQMPAAKIGGRVGELLPLEFNIGEPGLGAAGDIVDAGQAPANPN